MKHFLQREVQILFSFRPNKKWRPKMRPWSDGWGEKMLKQILLDVQKVFWGSESEALLLRDMTREGETSHLKTTSVSTLTFKRFGLLILFWIATVFVFAL